jgi:hypothetical protein
MDREAEFGGEFLEEMGFLGGQFLELRRRQSNSTATLLGAWTPLFITPLPPHVSTRDIAHQSQVQGLSSALPRRGVVPFT